MSSRKLLAAVFLHRGAVCSLILVVCGNFARMSCTEYGDMAMSFVFLASV